MTIYRTLLAHGYLPKELPSFFSSESFANFAVTKAGGIALETYKPPDNFTECVKYSFARPGHERRELSIPHPATFTRLARLTAKNFPRLLKNAHRSSFSRSAPAYSNKAYRAIHPRLTMGNLPRERASIRGGARFLLQTDVSQFYASLYTHAVGWAIDPPLRKRANWKSQKYLGKKLDQVLMDLQAKESQGIPIGNDVSFLLAEGVLSQVDNALNVEAERSYRWFDDYEFACDTLEDAEQMLSRLRAELGKFRLRTNPAKTRIVELPQPADDEWRTELVSQSNRGLSTARDMVHYFDCAFRLAERYPHAAILNYAVGVLFRVKSPSEDVGRVAQSAMTQTLLAEPGAAQKVFALLTYWALHGFALNVRLITETIDKLIARHASSGVTSDVSWALAFCRDNRISLQKKCGKLLSSCDDDCISLQALHLHATGILTNGFSPPALSAAVRNMDLDGPHWLLCYEAARHGFLTTSVRTVATHTLFSQLLAHGVSFLRTSLPPYSSLLHPGGAPSWLIRQWYQAAFGIASPETPIAAPGGSVADMIAADASKLSDLPSDSDDFRLRLLGIREEWERTVGSDTHEPYG